MKFQRYAQMKYGLGPLDLVPFVDVIVQLIAFYVLTTALTLSPHIDLKLPKAVVSADVEEKNLVVTITGENVVYLRDQIVSLKDLKVQMGIFSKQNLPILIRADRRASVGRIVDVWDLCRASGIEKVNIATDHQ